MRLLPAVLCAAAASGIAVSEAQAAEVRLVGPSCASPGSVIEVEVVVDPEGAVVVGLQALMKYDPAVLRWLSFEDGDSPYVVEIWSSHDPVNATFDVAVGFDPAQGQSSSSPVAVAKRVRFEVLAGTEECGTPALVSFRVDPPFSTLLTGPGGVPVVPDLSDLGSLSIAAAPSIVGAADMTLSPPARADCVAGAVSVPLAESACGSPLTPTFVRSDGRTSLSAPMCKLNSPVAITWTATDECGRTASVTQTITIPGLPADLDSDNIVDSYDLAWLLATWGSTSGAGDINGDLIVDGDDLAILLARWTLPSP